MKLMTKM